MKEIEVGVYTTAHNLVLVNKTYDFISLFIKGNTSVLKGNQINKVHIFLGFSKSTYKLFELLDEIAKSSKSKIIVHSCTATITNILATYIKNNNNSVSFRYELHKNKEPFELNDDSGKLTIYPYNIGKDDSGNNIIRTKLVMNAKKKKIYNKKGNNENGKRNI